MIPYVALLIVAVIVLLWEAAGPWTDQFNRDS